MTQAAGIMYRSDGAVLLMRRAAGKTQGGTWAFPAGGIEDGETPEGAARREFHEETGNDISSLTVREHGGDDNFALFAAEGPRFNPKLDAEHSDYKWADFDNMPQPLHPGVHEAIQRESERHNATQYPKKYYAKHMQPGLCGYGKEKILVDVDAMKRMIANKAVGKPVYILHNSKTESERLSKIEEEAAGYITQSFYNDVDGWAWFEILVVRETGHQAIARGWKCSDAYYPTSWGQGGKKNAVEYQRELMDAEFTHLAIVPDPRYEDAVIYTPEQFKAYQEAKKRESVELQNSKGKPMFKMFKNERKEVTSIDADTLVELEGGEVVSIGEMQNALKEIKNGASDQEKDEKDRAEKAKAEAAKREEMENAMVDCDGEKMTVKEMTNRYKSMKKNSMERKNAEDEDAKKKADKEAEEKKNAEDEAKKKADEEKKNGNEFYNSLANAEVKRLAETMQPQAAHIGISADATAVGKSRYGSGK